MDADPLPNDAEALSPGRISAHVFDVYDGGGLLTVCAWCRRILVQEHWIHPPAGALSIIDEARTMTHSICPPCMTTLARAPLGASDTAMGPPGFEPGTKGL